MHKVEKIAIEIWRTNPAVQQMTYTASWWQARGLQRDRARLMLRS